PTREAASRADGGASGGTCKSRTGYSPDIGQAPGAEKQIGALRASTGDANHLVARLRSGILQPSVRLVSAGTNEPRAGLRGCDGHDFRLRAQIPAAIAEHITSGGRFC